jgi:uncharacterized membrane protein
VNFNEDNNMDLATYDENSIGHRPTSLPKSGDDKCCHAITINKPPQEVYTFCQDEINFESFIKKMDIGFICDVRVMKDEKKRTIAWHSTERSEIKTIGNIWFQEAPVK